MSEFKPAFNPEAFTVSHHPGAGTVWGNGHTPESMARLKGWRCLHAWFTQDREQVVLLGRPSVPGCATVVLYGGSTIENGHWVKVFNATPQQVMATKDSLDAWLKLIEESEICDTTIQGSDWGWGLVVKPLIEECMAELVA